MSKVLTIGEAMGLLIAEEMGPLEEVEHFSRHVCGAELNYAVGMARLGNDVSYISKVGVDPFGKCICNFLKANGIHDDYVWTDDDHMTGFQMKEKVLEGDPTVANIRKHTAFSHFRPADLSGIDWTGVDHLHVTGIPLALSESCRETIYTLMMRAHGKGVRISFDPNLRPMLWKSQEIMARVINDAAQYADIVMPGLNEGRILTGMTMKEISPATTYSAAFRPSSSRWAAAMGPISARPMTRNTACRAITSTTPSILSAPVTALPSVSPVPSSMD